MIALVFLPLVAFWILLVWVTTRPGASYVGTPFTRLQILMRAMAFALHRTYAIIGRTLLPAFEQAARQMRELGEALKADGWTLVGDPDDPDAPPFGCGSTYRRNNVVEPSQ